MVKVSNKSISVDIKKDLYKVSKVLKKMKKIKYLDPSIERKKKISNSNFQLVKGTSSHYHPKLK